jgi:hypothetical protein
MSKFHSESTFFAACGQNNDRIWGEITILNGSFRISSDATDQPSVFAITNLNDPQLESITATPFPLRGSRMARIWFAVRIGMSLMFR